MIISNIAAPLLGLVDTAIIGHLPDAIYLSAVAVGAMVVSFIYLLAVFLRMATTGYIAQSYGADDIRAQRQHFNNGIIIALGLGVLIAVASPLINDLAMGYRPFCRARRLRPRLHRNTPMVCTGFADNAGRSGGIIRPTKQPQSHASGDNHQRRECGDGCDTNPRLWTECKGAAQASLSAEWVTAIVGFYWTARALGWHLRHWQLKFQQLRQF